MLEAVLERLTYANEDTGYTIARAATEGTGPGLLTVVGPLLAMPFDYQMARCGGCPERSTG